MTDSAPYVKFMRSEATTELLKHPNSFTLLALIAQRARREVPVINPYELKIGDAMLGDPGAVGLTRQEFRTAISNLQKWGFITTRTTNKGTIANLLNTSVYDINPVTDQPSKQPDNNQQHNQTTTTNKNDKKERRKEDSSSAADAATTSSFSSSTENSVNKKPTAGKGKVAARADEVAALELPHPAAEFAQLWADFLTSAKQAKKPITGLKMMLGKLGKYPEGFALTMLEDAIQGDWQGIENAGTAEKFEKWKAQAPRVSSQPSAPQKSPVRPEVADERAAATAANLAVMQAEFHARNAAKGDPTALPMPHPSTEFAELWAGFMASPKQQGKTMEAYQLMLKQLGEYPERFAWLMLERAIAGDWQAVVNDGTAEAFTKWKLSQAGQPAPSSYEPQKPVMNPVFARNQELREEAGRASHLAYYGALGEGYSKEEAKRIGDDIKAQILERLEPM